MSKRLHVVLLAVAALTLGCDPQEIPPAAQFHRIKLVETDRVLVLAPHPDDEVIGCGGVLQSALAMGLPVRVVFFTHGDNNQWSFSLYRKHPVIVPSAVRRMGEVRRQEAEAADHELGLSPDQLTFLGYPDSGTYRIWMRHWANEPPLRGTLTRATHVPYADALREGAAYKGEDVLQDLTGILKDFKPTRIFVSHPADHNPDHRALYLFTMIALWDLHPQLQAEVWPYLIHFTRWPVPQGRSPDSLLLPPKRLGTKEVWGAYELTEKQATVKEAALLKHRSQMAYSGQRLLSFVRRNELFGNLAPVNLTIESEPTTVKLESRVGEIEAPEELSEAESSDFPGLEERTVILDHGVLKMKFRLTSQLTEGRALELNLFGYRSDKAFARMPKLRVLVKAGGAFVYDQSRPLPAGAVTIRRLERNLEIDVPLALLDNPQKILTSAHTSLGEMPVDWLAWRDLELEPLK